MVATISDGNLRRRTAEVRIKLQPEVAQAFEAQAASRGLPPATLGAYVLGEWLDQQQRNLRATQLGVLEASRSMVKSLTDPEVIQRLLINPDLRRLFEGMPQGGHADLAGSSAAPEAAASAGPRRSRGPGEDRARSAT